MTTTQPKLGTREKLGYGIGALGEGMAFNLVASFYMIYCTDSLGISASFMAVMFFFARLWDAANDPIMGTLSENIRPKWGKHRPWIILGAVANAVVLAAMFSPALSRLASPLFAVTALYILWDMTYTIIDVPYYAYAACFIDMKERDQISVIPRILGGIAITMGTLYFAGYVSTKADLMGDAGTAAQITEQPAAVGLALHILMFALPPLILLGALWLYLKKYKLHGAFLERVMEENRKKREEIL